VTFTVLTSFGAPIENVTIEAKGVNTTATGGVAWDWLGQILGISFENTPIYNTTMFGETDSNGVATMLMVDSVKYNMSFRKTGYATKNLSLYPSRTDYVILLEGPGNFFGTCDAGKALNFSVVTTKIAANQWLVAFNMTDAVAGTLAGKETLNRTNTTTHATSSLWDLTISEASINHTYMIYQTSTVNSTLTLHTNFTHSSCGIVKRDFGISFPSETVIGTWMNKDMLFWFAAFAIFFCGCLFGATSAEAGALVVVVVAVIFDVVSYRFYAIPLYYPNILVDSGMMLLAGMVAILANMMVRSKKEAYV
jgi:hypothetical protein